MLNRINTKKMSTDYKTKLFNATLELHEKGFHRKKTNTLVFRFLRVCGFDVRLPAYSEPKWVLLYTSFYFTVLIAALYGYVQFKTHSIDFSSLALASIIFGGLAGIIMMWLTGYNQKKFELTPWEEL